MESMNAAISSADRTNKHPEAQGYNGECAIKQASMDIGDHAHDMVDDRKDLKEILCSSEQAILREIEDRIGPRQVNERDLEGAPDWLIRKAMDKEVSENWSSVTEEVGGIGLPNDANILSTHFVFKIKKDENGNRTLKARLVENGNRDDEYGESA